jgi:hypothetical protein
MTDALRPTGSNSGIVFYPEMTRTSSTAAKMRDREPIAIIGIGCRFPGSANTLNAFCREALGATEEIPTAALLMIDAAPEQSCKGRL